MLFGEVSFVQNTNLDTNLCLPKMEVNRKTSIIRRDIVKTCKILFKI